MIDFWCGKCRQGVSLPDKHGVSLLKHLRGECVEHLREVSKKYRQGRDWPKDPPPDWIICRIENHRLRKEDCRNGNGPVC